MSFHLRWIPELARNVWTTGWAAPLRALPAASMSIAFARQRAATLASLISAVNFIVTIFNMRAKGMKLLRMPVFIWMTLVVAFLLLFSLPCAIGGILLGDRVIKLLYGSHFAPAGPLLSLLLCALPIRFLVGLARQSDFYSLYVNAVEDGRYLGQVYENRLRVDGVAKSRVKIGSASIGLKALGDIDLDVLTELLAKADEATPPDERS